MSVVDARPRRRGCHTPQHPPQAEALAHPRRGHRKVARASCLQTLVRLLGLSAAGQLAQGVRGWAGAVLPLPWAPAPLFPSSALTPAAPQPRRRLSEREAKPPLWELVVARLDGPNDLGWLDEVPDSWHVTVYESEDGGGVWPKRALHRVAQTEPGDLSAVVGQHFETYYSQLAQYTVFVPHDALYHSPWLTLQLRSPESLKPLQPLGIRRDDNHPPEAFLRACEGGRAFRSERISSRTLESIFYAGDGHLKARSYRNYYQLREGENLVTAFLASIGLPQWASSSIDVMSAPFAGMVGVRQDLVLQHPRRIYQELRLRATESPVVGALAEHSLLVLFGGAGYNDRLGRAATRHGRGRANATALASPKLREGVGEAEKQDALLNIVIEGGGQAMDSQARDSQAADGGAETQR